MNLAGPASSRRGPVGWPSCSRSPRARRAQVQFPTTADASDLQGGTPAPAEKRIALRRARLQLFLPAGSPVPTGKQRRCRTSTTPASVRSRRPTIEGDRHVQDHRSRIWVGRLEHPAPVGFHSGRWLVGLVASVCKSGTSAQDQLSASVDQVKA